jgi:hypothetical protein
MAKIALKVICITVLTVISYMLLFYVVIFFTNYEYKDDYMSAYMDKKNLLQTTPAPKIIFVGGSNLAFGLDSEKIEKELGYKVINMGLHANIGLRYMIEDVKPYIGKDDVVVLIPEYALFYYGMGSELVQILYIHPDGIKNVRSLELYALTLREGNKLIRKKLLSLFIDNQPPKSNIYCRNAFNKHGDVVSHLKLAQNIDFSTLLKRFANEEVKTKTLENSFDEDLLNYIREFIDYVNSRNAEFVLIFPCLMKTYYEEKYPLMLTVYDKLKRSGIKFNSTPKDYIFPDSYFYDSEYHLNGYGRKVRTLKVIDELQKTVIGKNHNAYTHYGLRKQDTMRYSSIKALAHIFAPSIFKFVDNKVDR